MPNGWQVARDAHVSSILCPTPQRVGHLLVTRQRGWRYWDKPGNHILLHLMEPLILVAREGAHWKGFGDGEIIRPSYVDLCEPWYLTSHPLWKGCVSYQFNLMWNMSISYQVRALPYRDHAPRTSHYFDGPVFAQEFCHAMWRCWRPEWAHWKASVVGNACGSCSRSMEVRPDIKQLYLR